MEVALTIERSSVGMGGTPQGKVSCHDLSGLMRPKGQKEWFGAHFLVCHDPDQMAKETTRQIKRFCQESSR